MMSEQRKVFSPSVIHSLNRLYSTLTENISLTALKKKMSKNIEQVPATMLAVVPDLMQFITLG